MIKILLTGAQGQLGYALQGALAPLGEVKACDRQALDIRSALEIDALCTQFQPHWIINAAAYTAVDKAEDKAEDKAKFPTENNAAMAWAINCDAVGFLAKAAARCGAGVIHYSSDYVFDGHLARPYREEDPTGPLSVYGASKQGGEEVLLASGVPHLIFRTSWVFGVQGKNFAHTIYRLGKSGKALSIIQDQIGAPTSVDFLAQLTALIVGRYGDKVLEVPSGIYHASCAGQTSWHEYADFLLASCGLDEARARLVAIPSSQYPQKAQRPANSCLDNSKLKATFGIISPPWQFYVARWAQAIAHSL